MLWLVLTVLLVIICLQGWQLWMLMEHLKALQTLQQALRVWVTPEAMAKPMPVPGTSFVVSDAEVAARERELLANSKSRKEQIESRLMELSRPGSRRSRLS